MTGVAEAPFFVVGCARSGTTLVRWMLREHPRLAIPAESPWVVELAPRNRRWSTRRAAKLLDRIMSHDSFGPWALSEAAARDAVARRRPSSYGELVGTLFAAHAKAQGKPRWGDKTPDNVLHLDLLAGLFPGAVFVHLIRDGREVAASLAAQPWTADGIVGKASWWRDCVTAGREAAPRLGPARYSEIRLEDLVADPEAVLRRVCDAIGEEYSPQMLDYPRRVGELDHWSPGTRAAHEHLAKPPTAGLRDWKVGISAEDRAAVTRICGPLLAELGYEAD